MENTGDYYVIGHLAQFTGLTDRTIRSYLASGILKGEKINGLWHFTPEQVEAFLTHPAVRPSILAKQNGIVYDFLLADKKQVREACVILDLPEEGDAHQFFCEAICQGEWQDIRFSFNRTGRCPRIILKGTVSDVLALVNAYEARQSAPLP